MKSSRWGLALGLFNPSILVQAVDTVTVRVPTGTCVPGAYTGSFHNEGPTAGSGSGSGSSIGAGSGPPKIVTGVDSNYGSYSLQGCYDASAGGYVITGAVSSTNMTLEYCASHCQGSPYFAIENGNTCICGSAGPSGAGVDIGEYGCMTSCTGNSAQCGGSPRYGIVYHCPTCTAGPGSSTVVVYPTTDSKGSTYLTSTTSTLPSPSLVVYSTTDSRGSSYLTSSTSTLPSTSLVVYSTTDSKGSSYLTSSTSTLPASSSSTTLVVYSTTDSQGSAYVTSKTSTLPITSPSSTSVMVYSTTDSKGSSYMTSTTLMASPTPYPTGSIVVVVTSTQNIITTDSHGSAVTSVSTVVTSSTTTYSGTPPATNSANPSGRPSFCPGAGSAGSTYTDTAGQTYQVGCGCDFPYNDLITPHVATFPDCLLACDNYVPSQNVANNAACVAVAFGYSNPGGNCYLKYAISTINTGNGGFDCARMVGYTPPSPTTVSLGEPGHSSSSGAQSYPQGTTSPTAPQGYTSPAGGQSSPAIVGTSTSGGAGLQTYPTSAGPAGTVAPSQSAFPCPSYDGIAYIDVNGQAYNVECSADYSYYDLPGTQHIDTFQDCILACDAYQPSSSVAGGADCVGVTWGQTNPGGNCYLKYQIVTTTYGRSGLDSAYKAGYQKPAQSNTPSSSAPPSLASTFVGPSSGPALSGTTSSQGPSYGPALPNITPTLLPLAASYGPVSSPTPSSSGTPSSAAPGYGNPTTSTTPTRSPTSSPAPYSGTEPVCPAGNNTQYTNRYGTSYEVRCGVNLIGNNAKPAHADTFSRCLEFCDILHGCAGATWIGARPAPESNCYPYETFTGQFGSAPDSVYSGVPIGGPTNNDVGQSHLCPSYAGGTYLDIFGNTYNIGCGFNATGTNLYDTQTNTLQGCLLHCSSYTTCVGVTFQGTDGAPLLDSNTPNCFPISSLGPIVAQSNCEYATLAA